jgi:hypothetical protein
VCVLFGHAWRTRAYADGYRCDRCDRTKDGKARAALAAEEPNGAAEYETHQRLPHGETFDYHWHERFFARDAQLASCERALKRVIDVAGEALGTEPELRSSACVDALAQWCELLKADKLGIEAVDSTARLREGIRASV